MAWPNKKVPPPEYFIPLLTLLPVSRVRCPARGWRNPPATMAAMLEAGTIVFGPDETTQPQRKYLLKDNLTTNVASVIPYGGSDDRLIEELGIPFDTVKPVELIKPLVASCTSATDIVLDFFAGSGSVAHAVALQNDEDGGAPSLHLDQHRRTHQAARSQRSQCRLRQGLRSHVREAGRDHRAAGDGQGAGPRSAGPRRSRDDRRDRRLRRVGALDRRADPGAGGRRRTGSSPRPSDGVDRGRSAG